MKITFIIGNGFDIGLGLKTSYSDFISEYADLTRPYNQYTIEAKLKKHINTDRLSWADAEVAYARLPFDLILEGYDDFDRKFLELLGGFQGSLNEYLTSEANRFSFYGINRGISMRSLNQIFNSLIEGLPPEQSVSFLEELKDGHHLLRSINFNYTETFDALVCQGADDILIQLQGSCNFHLETYQVVHVHGKLHKKNTVFGVTDARYIKSEKARDLCRLTSTFLKEETDREERLNGYNSALAVIDDADVIVIFGTSMGMSDSAWWSKVINCLKTNTKLRVFIYDYIDNPQEAKTGIDKKLLQKRGREALFRSLPYRNDEVQMRDVWACVDRITVLSDGPYTRMNGTKGMGDPWDLSAWSKKFVRS
jgi:hypothetical protein